MQAANNGFDCDVSILCNCDKYVNCGGKNMCALSVVTLPLGLEIIAVIHHHSPFWISIELDKSI